MGSLHPKLEFDWKDFEESKPGSPSNKWIKLNKYVQIKHQDENKFGYYEIGFIKSSPNLIKKGILGLLSERIVFTKFLVAHISADASGVVSSKETWFNFMIPQKTESGLIGLVYSSESKNIPEKSPIVYLNKEVFGKKSVFVKKENKLELRVNEWYRYKTENKETTKEETEILFNHIKECVNS